MPRNSVAQESDVDTTTKTDDTSVTAREATIGDSCNRTTNESNGDKAAPTGERKSPVASNECENEQCEKANRSTPADVDNTIDKSCVRSLINMAIKKSLQDTEKASSSSPIGWLFH